MSKIEIIKQAFEVAKLLGHTDITLDNHWFYEGQRAGKYAFRNAKTNEWAFV